MPSLIVLDRSGAEHELTAQSGQTVMEAIRDAGLDDLLALCGGCCSCATCHVHVDRNFSAALPAITDDESDLLDASEHRDDRSRLSCQLRMEERLAGLRVTIAAED